MELNTKTISMVLNRQKPDAIGDKPAQVGGSAVTFPPPDQLFGRKMTGMNYVDSQVKTETEAACFNNR